MRMMDEASEDELLLAAMIRMGAKTGAIGGGIAGALGSGAGARGGARGAARVFKRTKRDVSTATSVLAMSASAASELVCRVLAVAGDLVGTESREDGTFAARALIRVGVGGLNPAVVTAVITGGPEGTVGVELRAAGREGLIKQHPADKALAKVSALLSATA